MSWKSFACLAVVAALSAPAMAQTFTTNERTLQVEVTETGSVAVEVAITAMDGVTLTGTLGDALFDTDNPGNNPFTGTVTNGLVEDANTIFYSVGSDVLSPGTYDLLTVSADASFEGLIAQLGAVNDGLTGNLSGPTGGLMADFDGDGDVDLVDLNILGANFGTPVPVANGDADGDMDSDLVDLNILGSEFGTGTAVAVPEPASLAVAALGMVAFAARRRV